MCHKLLKPLALGLGLVVLALLWLGSGAPPAVRAALAQGLGQAGPTCTVCLDGGCDYTTIQAAVDDLGCQEIKVAQGVYSGVQGRPVPAGYPYPPANGLITQVVYISRTVVVRGGYTTTNWTTLDPVAQPTTLDAGRLGRVMVIAGDISPTIEGLGMTNGDAAGLGGDYGWGGSGGGMYAISATATLSACQVFSNRAYKGGGLALYHSPATLSANDVISNTADWYGGGLYLWYSAATFNVNNLASNLADTGGGLYLEHSPATLSANNVSSNTAAIGGGLFLWISDATLSANSVTANTASDHGGGLFLESSNNAMLSANNVASNTAEIGGGLFLDHSSATLSANSVTSNSASYGGGLVVDDSDATLINTVVAGNQASAKGSGLYFTSAIGKPPSAPRLLHTTLAGNGGSDGSGLYLDNAYSGTAAAWLTNTILVSQSVGITVAEGCTATMGGTLWYGNGTNWGGEGSINRSGDYTGAPAFMDPGGGDYHLCVGSAAIDRGVDAGVTTDKDGLPRDAQPDLGAYEFQGPVTYTHLPVIWKGAR